MKSQENKSNLEAAPEALPRRFERLWLLRELARGGMGEVFLAAAGAIEGAERPCVVKIIRREHSDDPSFLARFFDEARIQSQLQHPGVAQIVEASTTADEKPYVVAEYVEGRNLGEVRSRATSLGVRVNWADAIALAVSLGEGLSHMHEATDANGRKLDIVHRDLSPQNVMVSYGGDVKLIDFGTARGENRKARTVAGIVFAKPGYVAPEVANNNPGGIPADLYAFGVMLWELLAGRRFLTGDATQHLALVGAGKRQPGPLAELVGAPKELDTVIRRLTATQLTERYRSAREAVTALLDLLKRAPTQANGDRSVRGRIASMMHRLYPAEPARSRVEFQRLLSIARKEGAPQSRPVAQRPTSPVPAESREGMLEGTRYRLVREIGKGSMGIVYEAEHVDLGRRLALKLLASNGPVDSAWVGRFRAEARVMSQIDHPNVVKFQDYGVSGDGRPFYVMELLEGETLEAYLEREKGMDFREAVRLGVAISKALGAVHAAGSVHLDVKPANLFLTKDGGLKLLDFGVANVGAGQDTQTKEAQAKASQPNAAECVACVGTPEYLAPEQAKPGAVDKRADIYAVGVVLYQLLTGALPFDSTSVAGLLEAKQSKIPESPIERAANRGIPTMLNRTVMRSLEREPARRFQTTAELAQALTEALAEPEPGRARRRAVGFSAVAGVLMGCGVIGLLATRDSKFATQMSQFGSATSSLISEKLHAWTKASQAPDALAKAANESNAKLVAEPEAPSSAPSTPIIDLDADLDDEVDTQAMEKEAMAEAASDEPEMKVETAPAEPKIADAAKPASDLEGEIAQAEDMMAAGSKIRGFNLLRKLGKKHGDDARVLRAWSQAAVGMKSWGEAHKVAKKWAELDNSLEARLFLARMQRATGRGDYEATLRSLGRDFPEEQAVKAAISELDGRVARN